MAIQSDFTSLFNSLISNLNSGGQISAQDTISSFISSLTNATDMSDTSSYKNFIDTLSSNIKNGKYTSEQIGDATKNLVNSLNSEISSGKYTDEQIGTAAKKLFSSMKTGTTSGIDSLSSSELGKKVKNYVTEAKTGLSNISSSTIGDNIKNNINTYTDKFKNGDLSLNDLKGIKNATTTKAANATKTAKKKLTGIGSPLAKTTKKTKQAIKKTTKKVTKSSNKKLTQKAKTLTSKMKKTVTNSDKLKTITSTNFATGETIYYDHDKARSNAQILQECYESIIRDNNEIDTILTDLNGFWRGSLATKFADQFQHYREIIKQYTENLQDGYDNLKNGSTAYSDFDDYFVNKSI